MKNYFFILTVLLFSFSVTAQDLPTKKMSEMSKSALSTNTKDVNKQIASALLKDEGLQKKAISYLKDNPDTKTSLLDMISKNKGSSSSLMKSILDNKELSMAAINYIKDNPKLLKKAMKIIGL